MQTFFGLGYESSLYINQEIFNLIYFGKGGFTFDDVYEMPVNKRKLYTNMLIKQIETENKQYEDSKNK